MAVCSFDYELAQAYYYLYLVCSPLGILDSIQDHKPVTQFLKDYWTLADSSYLQSKAAIMTLYSAGSSENFLFNFVDLSLHFAHFEQVQALIILAMVDSF